jgi:putative ABC transport system substrate-binding protein
LPADLDPVESGLVASLNRPGGNITGVILMLTVLGAKRLQMLRGLLPTAAVIGVLVNPSNPGSESETKDRQQAAQALGIRLEVLRASADRDLDAAFARLVERRAAALLDLGEPTFHTPGLPTAIVTTNEVASRIASGKTPTRRTSGCQKPQIMM